MVTLKHHCISVPALNVGSSRPEPTHNLTSVIKKVRESEIICSFEFMPLDGDCVADFKPGQYLSIYIEDDSLAFQEIRQYSLTTAANGKSYRIAVKREAGGTVSNYLHHKLQEGDILRVSPPRGDFFLDLESNTPVALISAGVGQTPMLSMLNTLYLSQHKASVYWLHASENGRVHAFSNEVATIAEKMPNLNSHIWYREPTEQDVRGIDYHTQGLMDLANHQSMIFDNDMHYYFCGPVQFMQYLSRQLITMGVKTEKMHYECFGPHKII